MEKSRLRNFLLVLYWLVLTVFMVMAGYWVSGALTYPVSESGTISYPNRLLSVIGNPFGFYFNEYSPVGIVAGFIIAELVFGIAFVLRFSRASIDDYAEELNSGSFDSVNDVFMDGDNDRSSDSTEKKDGNEEDNRELYMSGDVYLKLINLGYSMAQINAMMEMGEYMPDVDEYLLSKTFRQDMSPDDIRSYIEAFYG